MIINFIHCDRKKTTEKDILKYFENISLNKTSDFKLLVYRIVQTLLTRSALSVAAVNTLSLRQLVSACEFGWMLSGQVRRDILII